MIVKGSNNAPNPMQKLQFDPATAPAPLSEVLKSCWVMRSSAEDRQTVPDLLIPDGCPEIIFVYQGGYRKVALHQPEVSQRVTESCLVGLQTQTQLVTRVSPVHIVGLKLKPAGFYRLFPKVAAEAAQQNLPISQLRIPWLQQLETQLKALHTAVEILDHLQGTLPLQCIQMPDGLAIVQRCIEAQLQEQGQIPIQELARQHHRSIRQLQRYFKQYTGITPKQFARLIRFKALYKDSVIREVQPGNYFQYGYFDQMHFIKDFKAHLGITPTAVADRDFQQQNEMARISRS